jgi:hypothetical protein
VELDFSGIEAVLTGWFAQDPAYIRLAQLGPHACLAYHAIGQPPDLTKPDAELKVLFSAMKADQNKGTISGDPFLYNRSKSVCHGVSYGLTEYGMHENWPAFFPTLASGKKLIDLFYNQLAPKIRDFHRSVRMQAQNDHYLGGESHPFRYKHWFWSVVNYQMISATQKYKRQKEGGWCTEINGRSYAVRWGEDSKRSIAFFPQSTATGILIEAMLALFHPASPDCIGDAYYGRMPLRAPIHDSLLTELPLVIRDRIAAIIAQVMQRPIPQLPLRPEWDMGEALAIGVDAKASAPGGNWAAMAKLDLGGHDARAVPETVSDAPALGVEDEDDDEMVESLGTVVGMGKEG